MSVNTIVLKDKKYRKLILNMEIKKIRIDFLRKQLSLNLFERQFLYYKYLKKVDFRIFFKIKNICLLTFKNRSVFNFFRLNRMSFKNLASYGNLPGIIRASW